MHEIDRLLVASQQMGVELQPPQAQRLLAYLTLLEKWNKVHNLTAVREAEKMLTHHLLDSLSVVPYLNRELRVIDVGSGGGLPGIPFAIVRPEVRVTLLDSNHKKTSFLQQAVIELALENVDVVTERVEEYEAPEQYTGIMCRAFAETAEVIRLTQALLAPAGRWYLMKGVYPEVELAQLPPGVIVQGIHELSVPNLAASRHLLVLERVDG
jgi:16S rRNA (guanine527-N7)-methyltransferase